MMEKIICVGDVVISTAGRDRGEALLVIEVQDKFALTVDGRTRKVLSPKRKNVKHLKKVSTAKLKLLAERILNGEAVGNERVYRAVKAEKGKIQED